MDNQYPAASVNGTCDNIRTVPLQNKFLTITINHSRRVWVWFFSKSKISQEFVFCVHSHKVIVCKSYRLSVNDPIFHPGLFWISINGE